MQPTEFINEYLIIENVLAINLSNLIYEKIVIFIFVM